MQVYMRQDEMRELEKVIASFDQPVDVFEWGSGGSTLHFSALPNVRHWVACEHDHSWFLRLRRLLDQGKYHKIRTKISLLERTTELSYLAAPQELPYLFDVIIVDGRWRNQCLEIAQDYLKEGGCVILHDCDRERYQPSMSHYTKHRLAYGDKRHQGLMRLTFEADPDEFASLPQETPAESLSDAIAQMNMNELRELANAMDVTPARTKAETIERLQSALKGEEIVEE